MVFPFNGFKPSLILVYCVSSATKPIVEVTWARGVCCTINGKCVAYWDSRETPFTHIFFWVRIKGLICAWGTNYVLGMGCASV